MYWYVLVCTCTRLYKQVQDFAQAVWYKSVQVCTSQYFSFGTGQYKSVQDFQYRYRMVQDSTSQYKISSTGTGWYKTVQASHSTKFPVQVQDGTRQYKLVPDFNPFQKPIENVALSAK